MDKLLSKIESPRDLQALSTAELEELAGEMREVLCNLVSNRTAHFASNLGVVELCLALHTTFDFSHDRLIWDTGHQIYPHKLITGRYHEFGTIRTKGGLMGYPNPRRERLRPVHDRPRRLQRLDRPGPESRRRPGPASRDRHARRGDRRRGLSLGHRLRGDEQRRRARQERCWWCSTTTRCRSARAWAAWPTISIGCGSTRCTPASRPKWSACSTRCRCLGDPAERFLAQIKEADQGRTARRHVVRGARLPLHRPDRRPQHRPAAQVPGAGQRRRPGRCCCTW